MPSKWLFFGLLSLVAAQSQYSCPPQGGAYALCETTVLYIIDTSTDLSPTEVVAEFDWIRANILPGTAWQTNQNLALISYGTGNVISFPVSPFLSTACSQLGTLESSFVTLGSSAPNLYNLMQTVNLYYGGTITTMILFSASKEKSDISQTAAYIRANMPSQHFTVIAMKGADFSGFPATVYSVSDLSSAPPNLAPCLIKRSCNQDCDLNGPPVPTVSYTTIKTAPPTTPNKATQRTSTPAPFPYRAALQCQCNTRKVWVDMIFVVDASASTGSHGLDQMWDTAATILDQFNVQKSGYTGSDYYTKVGVITYGNDANVIYPLGSLNNDDIDGIFHLPFNNDAYTNLEAGLQQAVVQFDGPNHRKNARRVIVVMAAVYDPDGVTSPNKTATTFKESDGVLMVYNYVPEGGIQSDSLEELASPGYFFSTEIDSTVQDLATAQCDANCFCGPQASVFSTASPRGYPTDGCYIDIPTQTSYSRAKNMCFTGYNNGSIAYDQSINKNSFLQGMFPHPGMSFFIGLSFDSFDGQWEWPDGTPLGSYHPWVPGQALDGANGLQCASVNSNGQWLAVDCRSGLYYVCEMIPCDSLHYC